MRKSPLIILLAISGYSFAQTYNIVDTGVSDFYNNSSIISNPGLGSAFFGQDAQYKGYQPSYTDNGDGTISDKVSGLMWQKDMGQKISYPDAFEKADGMDLAGYGDWRVPTIKELYSLILFTGQVKGAEAIDLFIDTDYFVQPLGDVSQGEREIDAQTWSSTQYKGLTMNGDTTVFGVNFIDGRIKGYPKNKPFDASISNIMYFRMVRGNIAYGINDFEDNGDETISDMATGLMWQKADNGQFYDWEGALKYAENLEHGGYSDWRLPNAKELQSIIDYSRSPQATNSPAIDPIFSVSEISDPNGNPEQYPYFWTSTNHQDGVNPYSSAVYIAFGAAQGKMNGNLMDVHGAGAQRSDPKAGDINDYPQYFGPQGDVRYVYNAVRCVRDIGTITSVQNMSFAKEIKCNIFPNPISDTCIVELSEQFNKLDVEIINNAGQCILTDQWQNTNLFSLDLACLDQGLYYLKITTEEGTISSNFIKLTP